MSSDRSMEARTTAWTTLFYGKAKVSFTVRGGTTLQEVGEDLAVLRDALASVGEFGFAFNPALDTSAGDDEGEWDDIREALHWVRGTSRNGHPCLWGYADHEKVENKTITAYSRVIEDLPISQEQWDAAPVWPGKQPPEKTEALEGGYLQTFPQEMRFGGRDRGDDALFNGNRSYWWNACINPMPGGVSFGTKEKAGTTASAPAAQAVTNDSGEKCAECGAPAGKPHGTKCSKRISGLAGGAVQKGVVSAPAPTKRTFAQRGGEEKSTPSPRQKNTARLMMLGKSLYEDGWDNVRRDLVTQLGVESGSVSDISDADVEALIASLSETMVGGLFEFAGTANWTEDVVKTLLAEWNYDGLGTWDEDPISLPTQFLVKLFEEATKQAAEA